MVNLITRYKKTTAFMAGILSVAMFAPYFQVWAGVIGFSVLLYLLLCENKAKELFKIGYAFGFAHFAIGFSWVGNALLIDAERFGWLYPITLLAAGSFFGLFAAVPALMVVKGRTVLGKWLLFCGAWVVCEWIRSFLLTGFPWNLAGYSLAFDLPMIQNAAIGGVYLTSLLVIVLYSMGGLWLYRHSTKSFIFTVIMAALLISLSWGWGYWRLQNKKNLLTDTIVRIVQPSIPQTMKWTKESAENNFNTYVDLSKTASDTKPDMIIWGETASPFRLDEDDFHRNVAAAMLPKGSVLLTGMISYQYNKGFYRPHNSLVVLNDKGEIEWYYHKTHLVPFGEYIPLREYLPDFIRPVANAIGQLGKGDGAKVWQREGLPSIGGVICYEIIFPYEIVDEKNRPDVIVNVTNDGWYGESSGPYQHWVAAKFRAIEEGITVVRSANNGLSGMINAYGEEKGVLKLNYSGISDIKLEKSLGEITTYSRYGNIISLILCLILMLAGFIKSKDEL